MKTTAKPAGIHHPKTPAMQGGAVRILWQLFLLLFAGPLAALAQFDYSTDNGTITIIGGCPDGAVAIPSTIDGLPVTTIGNQAFSGCTRLTSVTIPNSVNLIGYQAFSGCTSLTAIQVDAGNSNFSSVDGVLFDKSKTRLMQCPGGKTGSYTIPNSVTTIGDGTFSGCTSLTSANIPNSVTSIGLYAFAGCTSLTNVTLPNSVTSIGLDAFYRCTSLTAIQVDEGNSNYSGVDGVLFDKDRTTLLRCPGGKTGSYTIPNSVTTLGFSAFVSCTSLTSVTLPNSVTSIEGYAFSGCTSLTAIQVDAGNSNYSGVDGVLFDKDRTTLLRCPGGKTGSYTIPNSVTTLGAVSFLGCTSLTSVTIPNSVTSIDGSAFSGCSGLTSVTIPNGVTNIGEAAFWGCTSLTSVTIPNTVTSIGWVAFSGCTSLTSVTLPNSVTSLGDYAFQNCTSLTNVTLPNSVTTLGWYAFAGCTSLTNVTLPNSVTSIGWYAFAGCTSLPSVTLPNTITTIGDSAFFGCTRLTSVYFQGNAPLTGDGVFGEVDRVTVYYLAGTTGWGATYAGLPTAIWSSPLILSNGPGFGVGADGFGFLISWAPNASVVVEASTDLAHPLWFPVSTNTPSSGTSQFSDPQWTDHPTRFYRVRTP